MPDDRLSKNERRDQAREQARLAREKQKRAERLRRILIPSGVTVVILAIVTIVILVVSTSAPAPQTSAGPKNMITDGILFTGQGGKAVPATTAALKPRETPSPAATPTGGAVQIITYVDWTCPYCQGFEETNADWIKQQVAAGAVTLEVRPVAILNRSYSGTQYSQRANNAAACVANYDPDAFLAVQTAMYTNQPPETGTGLTNNGINNIIHGAGLRDAQVDKCVTGVTFTSWVTAATNRFTSNSSLANPATGQLGTPTILVNGKVYGGSLTDASAFQSFVASAAS